MARIIGDIPKADDVAIAVIAAATVFSVDPEHLLLEQSERGSPSLARWCAYDLLCRGWPGCPKLWCARMVGYRGKQLNKVSYPKRMPADVQADVLRAWEALRARPRPSKVRRAEEIPAFLPGKPVVVPLPGKDATKARLRAFLATVVANTGGVKAS